MSVKVQPGCIGCSIGCIGHLQEGMYLGFPIESRPTLLGSGEHQQDAL